jgi:hypothetical protein
MVGKVQNFLCDPLEPANRFRLMRPSSEVVPGLYNLNFFEMLMTSSPTAVTRGSE